MQEYSNVSETLDIIFFEGFHIKSRIVQYLTFSPFSHIGILLGEDVFSSFAEVAPNNGFYFGSIEKYKDYKGNIYVSRIRSNKLTGDLDIIKSLIKKHQNTKYINLVGYKVFQKIVLRRAKNNSESRYICSELVEDVFKLLNISYKRRERDFVYPSDIEKSDSVEFLYKLKF